MSGMFSSPSSWNAGNLFSDTGGSYQFFDAPSLDLNLPTMDFSSNMNWNQPFTVGGMSPSQLFQQDIGGDFFPLAGTGQQQQGNGFLNTFAQGILGAAPGLAAGAGQMMAGNLRSGAFEAAAAAAGATTRGQARGFIAGVEGERLAAALRNQSIRNAQELGQTSLARQGNAQRYLVNNPGRAGILNSRAIYGV